MTNKLFHQVIHHLSTDLSEEEKTKQKIMYAKGGPRLPPVLVPPQNLTSEFDNLENKLSNKIVHPKHFHQFQVSVSKKVAKKDYANSDMIHLSLQIIAMPVRIVITKPN